MIRSQLQMQADKCRAAQENLEWSQREYKNQTEVVNNLETEIETLALRLKEEQAKHREIGMIHEFAIRAVNLHTTEMRKLCNDADPYGRIEAGACMEKAKYNGF